MIRRVTKTKLFYLCCIVTCVTAPALAEERAGSEYNDHLVPIDGIIEPAYQTLLSQKLFITPANFVRMVILPSAASEGEIAIAIHSEPTKSEEKVFVTCTKAKKNLWYAASDESGALSKNTSSIQIARYDVPIPKTVAMTIMKGIRRMLGQCKPLDKTNKTFVDETDIEVLLESSPSRYVKGLLTPHARGVSGTALRRITHLLEAYCGATPGNREQLLEKIEAKAKQLAK